MKENIKKMGFFLVASSLILSMMGCEFGKEAEKEKDKVETNITDEKENLVSKMNDIENDAKSDIRDAESVTKENVEEAVTYIDEHIKDPFKDNAVSEKLAYYGAYLKHLGAKTTEASKHELTKFGDNTYTYIKNVYTKTEEETSKVSTDLKTGIQNSLDTIKKDKDTLIDEFHKMIAK